MESCHEVIGDILPPKREAVVARLKRRIEGYRKHHSQALPLYQQNVETQYGQEREHTQQLQQRFFESKAKKSKKDKGSVGGNQTRLPVPNLQTGLQMQQNIPQQSQQENNNSHTMHIKQAEMEMNSSLSQKMPPSNSQGDRTEKNCSRSNTPNDARGDGAFDELLKNSKPYSTQIKQEAPSSNIEAQRNFSSEGFVKQEVQQQQQQQQQQGFCSNSSQNQGGAGSDFLTDTFANFPDGTLNPDVLRDLIADVAGNAGDLMADFNFDDVKTSFEASSQPPKMNNPSFPQISNSSAAFTSGSRPPSSPQTPYGMNSQAVGSPKQGQPSNMPYQNASNSRSMPTNNANQLPRSPAMVQAASSPRPSSAHHPIVSSPHQVNPQIPAHSAAQTLANSTPVHTSPNQFQSNPIASSMIYQQRPQSPYGVSSSQGTPNQRSHPHPSMNMGVNPNHFPVGHPTAGPPQQQNSNPATTVAALTLKQMADQHNKPPPSVGHHANVQNTITTQNYHPGPNNSFVQQQQPCNNVYVQSGQVNHPNGPTHSQQMHPRIDKTNLLNNNHRLMGANPQASQQNPGDLNMVPRGVYSQHQQSQAPPHQSQHRMNQMNPQHAIYQRRPAANGHPQPMPIPSRDPKMSPLNISSNPAFAEALAFNSGSGNMPNNPPHLQHSVQQQHQQMARMNQFRGMDCPQPNRYPRYADAPPPDYNNATNRRVQQQRVMYEMSQHHGTNNPQQQWQGLPDNVTNQPIPNNVPPQQARHNMQSNNLPLRQAENPAAGNMNSQYVNGGPGGPNSSIDFNNLEFLANLDASGDLLNFDATSSGLNVLDDVLGRQ